MSWINDLQIGDCWYNIDKDHVAMLENKTETHIFYQWKHVKGQKVRTQFPVYGLLRVKIEDAEKHAMSWTKLSALEKELL